MQYPLQRYEKKRIRTNFILKIKTSLFAFRYSNCQYINLLLSACRSMACAFLTNGKPAPRNHAQLVIMIKICTTTCFFQITNGHNTLYYTRLHLN